MKTVGMIIASMTIISTAMAQDDALGHVTAAPDGNGGVRAEAAVDVGALVRNDAVRDAAWYAKPFVAAMELGKKAVDVVVDNPGKTALAVVSGYIVVRAIDGKLDDDWDKLRGKSSSGSNPPTPTYDFGGANIDQVVIQQGTGNTSTQSSTQPAPEPAAEPAVE